MKIKKSCLIIVVGALGALLAFFTAVFLLAGYSWPPDIRVLSSVASPGNQWIAVIEDEEYVSMFTPPFYVVALRPQEGWLRQWREKKIFQISRASANALPIVKWQGADVLIIKTDGLKRDISLQASEYQGIKIFYDNE